MCRALEAMARRRGHAFSYADRVHLALGWGAGHAATHALFLCAALLPLAAGDGSLYAAACPAMSVFTAAALQCLGTSATLVAASVVGLEGWRRRSALHAAYAPAVHAASALMVRRGGLQGADGVVLLCEGREWKTRSQYLAHTPPLARTSHKQTLGSFAQGGCAASVPAVVAFGALNAAYAARYVWRHAPPPQPQVPLSPIGGAASRRPRREVHTAVVPAAAAAAAAAAGPPPVMAATGAAAVGGGGGGD